MAISNNDRQERFYWAAGDGDVAAVEQLLFRGGVQVNDVYSRTGLTALHAAARKGHYRMVCHLIQNGADVNSANTFGVTPLHAAARSGDKQVVQKLLDSGSVPVKDSKNHTPADCAMEEGNTDIVALLNRHALADLAAKGKAGARPLDTGAAQAGAAQESPIEDLANAIMQRLRVELATRDTLLTAKLDQLDAKIDAIAQAQARLAASLGASSMVAAAPAGSQLATTSGNTGVAAAGLDDDTAASGRRPKRAVRKGGDKTRKSKPERQSKPSDRGHARRRDKAAASRKDGRGVASSATPSVDDAELEWQRHQRAMAERRWAKAVGGAGAVDDFPASIVSASTVGGTANGSGAAAEHHASAAALTAAPAPSGSEPPASAASSAPSARADVVDTPAVDTPAATGVLSSRRQVDADHLASLFDML